MKTPVDKYRQIGKRIKKAREKARISQAELSKRLGFQSPTAISLIESGERRVAVQILENIARILRIDIQHLLGGEEKKVDLRFALRADKNLSNEDEQKILAFIEFVKHKKRGK